MLDEDSHEPFHGSEDHTVDDDRVVSLAVASHVLEAEPLGQLEVELDGSALPGPSDGIFKVEVELGSVERTVSLVDDVGDVHRFDGVPESGGGVLPVLVGSHGVLGPGGEFDVILESELFVHLVDDLHD